MAGVAEEVPFLSSVQQTAAEHLRRIITTEQVYCSELLDYYRSRRQHDITNEDVFEELCWVVYSSGFRYSVIRRYWESITNAYLSFRVDEVARLANDLKNNAKEICEVSKFHNAKKAEWCIFNARRLTELEFQLRGEGGVRGLIVDLSMRHQSELIEQIPGLIALFGFKGIGSTTIFHLLKNLGVDIFKPDRHLRRILADMGLTDGYDASIFQICSVMESLSRITGMHVNELDTILFHYGQRTQDSAPDLS